MSFFSCKMFLTNEVILDHMRGKKPLSWLAKELTFLADEFPEFEQYN